MAESFNLVDEPWIRVRGGTGVETVSLREAFARAPDLEALAGDSPTQDVAMLRLMLAVLARATDRILATPHDRWSQLWQQPTMPMEMIDDYLDRWRHRFDLFDAAAPFMQVAGLTASKTSGLYKLIPDVPDGYAFFTMRAGAAVQSLDFGEAARWVVHAQSYDTSGIKTGAVGDSRVKGGRGYPIGSGWAGRCGLVVLEHETLRDQLLLNFVPGMRESDDEDDRPIWEREPLTSATDLFHPAPHGVCDLFTWPIRRILLSHDGDRVTDVLLSNGDPIAWHNQHQIETMAAFRRSPTQEKKLGLPAVYMPHRLDPTRAIWRGLEALLAESPDGGGVRNEADERLAPRTLDWLAAMAGGGAIDPDLGIRLRAVGMAYGPQDASIASTYDDGVRMRLGVATEPALKSAAVAASVEADSAVQQLANLAANVARAAGRMPDGPRSAAREAAFARLDAPYRRWLASLSISSDLVEARVQWQRSVRSHVATLADEVVAAGGEAAWKGRESMGRHVDSSLAHAWFSAGLRKNLPLAWTASSTKEES